MISHNLNSNIEQTCARRCLVTVMIEPVNAITYSKFPEDKFWKWFWFSEVKKWGQYGCQSFCVCKWSYQWPSQDIKARARVCISALFYCILSPSARAVQKYKQTSWDLRVSTWFDKIGKFVFFKKLWILLSLYDIKIIF